MAQERGRVQTWTGAILPHLEAALRDYSRYAEQHLSVNVAERVALVTMDRPEKRNAINRAMHRGLEMIMGELSQDPGVGAIVLTGSGTAFSAGGDVSVPRSEATVSDLKQVLRGPKYLVQNFLNCEAPLIAAINGPAVGLGATIALLCDVTFMSDRARIADTHVNIGITAGDGGCVAWPALVGPHRAKEYLMTGRFVDAATAGRIGLVNHVVPHDMLIAEAFGYAKRLAHGAAAAIRWTKMAINRGLWDKANLVLETSLALEGMSIQTKEAERAIEGQRQRRREGLT